MSLLEIIDLVWYSIGTFFLIALLIFARKDLKKSKKMYPFMIIYHERKKETNTDEQEFIPVEFAKTEREAKAAAISELAGNLIYTSASIYFIDSYNEYMEKIAELGKNGNDKSNGDFI